MLTVLMNRMISFTAHDFVVSCRNFSGGDHNSC